MKDNFVKVVFAIDNSGSMYSLKNDVIGGFNEFVSEQKKNVIGTENVSLYYFNNDLTTVFKNKDINEVENLKENNYETGGGTAIYDAVCKIIDDTGEELCEMNEDERPSSVIVVIMTDGYENSSRKFSLSDAKQRIQHQTDKYSWKFVYIGADITDAKDAEDMGILNIGYSKKSDYTKTLKRMSDVVSNYRVSASCGDEVLHTTLCDMNDEYSNGK